MKFWNFWYKKIKWFIFWDKNLKDLGETNHDEHKVIIRDTLSDLNKRKTLFHELIHVSGDKYYKFEEKRDIKKFDKFTLDFFELLYKNNFLVIYLFLPDLLKIIENYYKKNKN